jgi:tRNA (guanine37-N1)-methyltransferase
MSREPKTAPRLSFHFLTLFPELLRPLFQASLMGKAADKGVAAFEFIQIRDFARDRHRTTDEPPYGGGEGMVLKADVLFEAWKQACGGVGRSEGVRTLLLSPQGRPFTQEMARNLAQNTQKLILVCGHYEGVDERFIEHCVDEEVSIGDYVLTGGELPAAVIADAVTRLVPGVVGNERSITEDSFEGGLLKYPQYTRPAEFEGRQVPALLMSGNHKKIAQWRHEQRRERTRLKRPDLWEAYLAKNPDASGPQPKKRRKTQKNPVQSSS